MRAVPLLLGLATALPPRTALAAKGVDGFGYHWYDSYEPECPFKDVTVGFSLQAFFYCCPDDIGGPFPIGFDFPFYGTLYNQVWISTNGWLSFSSQSSSYPGALPIPNPNPPNNLLAPLWTDLTPWAVLYGVVNNPDPYFVVRWNASIGSEPWNFLTEARLYPSGRIEFIYGDDLLTMPVQDKPKIVTGIEDPAGSGIGIWNLGSGNSGYRFRGDTSVCFIPPPRLACPASIGCNQSRSGSTAGVPNAISGYDCGNAILDGGEAAYRFTLSELTDMSASLAGTSSAQLFLLRGCDESACLAGATKSIANPLLPPGDYTLLVDSPAAGAGPYTLSTTCVQRSFPAACPSTVSGDIGSGAGALDAYGCFTDMVFPGPEVYYRITLPAAGNLKVKLAASCELDAFVFKASDVSPGSCLAHGAGGAIAYGLPAGDYVVVVEGRNGASCPFTASFSCGTELDCSAPLATLSCGDVVAGTTVGAADRVEDYSCRPGEVWSGGEAVYALAPPPGLSAGVVLEDASSPDLEAFLVSPCNEGNCVDAAPATAACEPTTASLPYYAVVDGKNGASGTFKLRLVCGVPEPPADWRRCESPYPSTTLDTRAATSWHWDTQVPTSGNPNPVPLGSYCGTACDFSFYVPVNCGSGLHLALNDVESAGNVRFVNAFTGAMANLSANNGGGADGAHPWSYDGQQVSWLSTPCKGHAPPLFPAPPDMGGGDPNFNGAVMDLAFAAGQSPCGLWRLDLLSMGGVDWDLYASCEGGLVPGYTVYDNVCDATAAYAPRAELDLSNVVTDGSCPNALISFDLENLGCASVNAPWRIDAGPGSVANGSLFLGPGQKLKQSWTLNVTSPSGKVRVSADPDDALLECSEVLGEACVTAGVHVVDLPACGCLAPAPPTGEVGNSVRAVKQGSGAELDWPSAPPLASVQASHFHVYRTDLKSGGAWTNLADPPDTLTLTTFLDAAALLPIDFYQVRFANDCELYSGGALP